MYPTLLVAKLSMMAFYLVQCIAKKIQPPTVRERPVTPSAIDMARLDCVHDIVNKVQSLLPVQQHCLQPGYRSFDGFKSPCGDPHDRQTRLLFPQNGQICLNFVTVV